MENLFSTVLNMSYVSSYVIVFVILLRLFLKKSPKLISYCLWIVVALRLIIPFNFESEFSIIPKNLDTAIVRYEIVESFSENEYTVITTDVSINEPITKNIEPFNALDLAFYIWIVGIILFSLYSVVSIVKLNKKLGNSKMIDSNIFEVENLKTPFVLGVFKPIIYLPHNLSDEEKKNVITHEQIHIKRYDHIIKIFAFGIAVIHWFNPLVWLSFVLMNNDMELSCDEKVLEYFGCEVKKSYATSLLTLATEKHISSCPLAFSEGNVKRRVKNVLQYNSKPVLLTVGLSFVVFIIGLMLLLNPVSAEEERYIEISFTEGSSGTGYGYSDNNKELIKYAYDVLNQKQEESIEDARILSQDKYKMDKYEIYFKGDEENNYVYYCDEGVAFIEKDGVYYSTTSDFAKYLEEHYALRVGKGEAEVSFVSENTGGDISKAINPTYLVIDNEIIYNSDKVWTQPDGFGYYILDVSNIGKEKLTIIVRNENYYEKFTVAPNSSKTMEVNDAVGGDYRVSFTTASGEVYGKISVRISKI